MKNVLILGASGFLGSYIANQCQQNGFQLYGVSRKESYTSEVFSKYIIGDVNSENISKILKTTRIDYCFHCASPSNVVASIDNPYADFIGCLPVTALILDLIRKYQPSCHVVLTSSAAVYGNPSTLPISELSEVCPLSPYGCHKLLAENLASEYSRLFNLRITVLRIFSAYGNGLKKQILWDACNKISMAIKNNHKEVSFYGTGYESRDFIHAQDLAKAAVTIARSESSGFNLFNVGSGHETSIKTVIKALAMNLDAEIEIKFTGEERKGIPSNWRADISKLLSLGHTSHVKINKGIEDYVKWFQQLQNEPLN